MALQHSSVARLYHTYRRVSGGGADGRVMGVNGSINPLAVFGMLMAMKVGGRTVFDFGCSKGRFCWQLLCRVQEKPLELSSLKTKGISICLTQSESQCKDLVVFCQLNGLDETLTW